MGSAQFDHIAQSYDTEFSDTQIGKAQRQLVWNVLDKYYPSFQNKAVLELNCGTGVDALKMAANGANILATDISPEMVKVTTEKTKNFNNVNAQILDINNLNSLDKKFDLVFSNFGGLNCLSEDEFDRFNENVSQIIKPQGRLIMVIMPKNTIWETFYFLAKGSLKKAFRRSKKGGVDANVSGKNVKTYYYNPSFFKTTNHFSIESITPIGLSVPPSYLENRYKDKPDRIDRYYEKDKQRFNAQRFAKYADHYCIVLKKK